MILEDFFYLSDSDSDILQHQCQIFLYFFCATFLTFFFSSIWNKYNNFFAKTSTKSLQLTKKWVNSIHEKLNLLVLSFNSFTYLFAVELFQRRAHVDFKSPNCTEQRQTFVLISKHDYLHINHLLRLFRQTVPDKYHNKYY